MSSLKEYILEVIQKTKIFEMAHDRAKVKDKIEGIADQLIHNWSLIAYCKLYDPYNWNFTHWKDELTNNLYSILKLNLKNGNESAKYRLIRQTLIDEVEITRYSYVKHTMHQKFKKEGFEVTDEIIQMFIDEVPVLIDIMSKHNTDNNYDKMLSYVESL